MGPNDVEVIAPSSWWHDGSTDDALPQHPLAVHGVVGVQMVWQDGLSCDHPGSAQK